MPSAFRRCPRQEACLTCLEMINGAGGGVNVQGGATAPVAGRRLLSLDTLSSYLTLGRRLAQVDNSSTPAVSIEGNVAVNMVTEGQAVNICEPPFLVDADVPPPQIPPTSPPTPTDDTYVCTRGVPCKPPVPVLANDTTPNGNLTVVVNATRQPENGTVMIQPNGTFEYFPPP